MPTANRSGQTPPTPAQARARWKPGQSGNPSGRPKSLRKLIAHHCGEDAAELVEIMVSIARGELTTAQAVGLEGNLEQVEPTIKERAEAARYLLDQFYGRASVAVELSGPDGGPIPLAVGEAVQLAALTDEELIKVEEAREILETTRRALPAPAGEVVDAEFTAEEGH